MNLREFLEQRELELEREIAELQAQLIPREAELAEIRRAKGAIGVSGSFFSNMLPLPDNEVLSIGSLAHVLPQPNANLTMKQLVRKALWQHFPGGATTRQLLDFFRDGWGREIDRKNLSPQISRLYHDGELGRIRSTRGWFYIHREGIVQGFRPYFDRNRVAWKEPATTTILDEPAVTREIDGFDDRMPYMRTITTNVNGLIDRREMLVWLLDHEVQPDDKRALRHQVPTEDDED